MNTMYNVDKKDNVIYLKRANEYGEFDIINEFHNKEELVEFLAYMSSGDNWTWWDKDRQWFNYLSRLWVKNMSRSNRCFRQNLSGKDFYYVQEHKKDVIWISEDEYRESWTDIYHKHFYPYKFVDAYDIPIDIDSYKNETRDFYFVNKDKISRNSWRINACGIDYKKQKKFYPRTQWHTIHGQGTGNNCRDYYRKNSFDEYDDDGELLYKVKPKYNPSNWGWCYGSRHSSGWKDKKYRHQWEHNLCNGNKKKHRRKDNKK